MKRLPLLILLLTCFQSFSQIPSLIFANDVTETICDSDGVDDGQTLFDMTTLIPEILGSNDPVIINQYTVDFYSDPAYINKIPNYTNTTAAKAYVLVTEKANPTNTATSTVTLTVISLPVLNIVVGPICVDSQTGIVTNSYIMSGYNTKNYDIQWKDSTGTVVSMAANFSCDTPGDYTLVVTTKSGVNCTASFGPFTVIESAKPAKVTYTVDGWFTENQTITVTAEPYIGDGSNFLYSLDGKTPQTNNVFTNVKTGPHEITVSDANGCGSTALPVTVQLIYNPKSFTPNGDGINDKWTIKGLEDQKDSQVFIYDRTGKLISQLFTNGDGWDGTFNGQPLPSTDYWFTVTYVEDGVAKEYKSHFSLIR